MITKMISKFKRKIISVLVLYSQNETIFFIEIASNTVVHPECIKISQALIHGVTEYL